MLSLSPPAARSAAVLLAAAAASLLFLGAVKPLLDAHRQLDARLEALEAEGALLRRAAAGRAEAERRLEARRARGAARGHYLAGRTPALAAAELQKLLRAAAGQGHGELVSTEVVKPAGFLESPSQSGLSRQDQNRKSNQGSRSHEITVRARVRGDTATLQRLLHALEAGPPILFVRDLTVDVARSLVIGVEVGGYMDSTVESIQRKSVAFTGGSPQSLAEGRLFFPPLEHFAEIVERTLFEPGRRPARERASGGRGEEELGMRGGEAGGLSLVGVVLAPEGRIALISDPAAGEVVRLPQGAAIGDWVVREVRSHAVVLEQAGTTRELLLHQESSP